VHVPLTVVVVCGPLFEVDVPGNGVNNTNCAKVRFACSARATVASKVSRSSLGKPKMNDPRT
jgi:hypothetical protein